MQSSSPNSIRNLINTEHHRFEYAGISIYRGGGGEGECFFTMNKAPQRQKKWLAHAFTPMLTMHGNTHLTFLESCRVISPVVLLWPSKSDPGVVVPGGGEATVMDPFLLRDPLAERRRDPVLSAPGLSLSLPLLPVGVANSSCVMEKYSWGLKIFVFHFYRKMRWQNSKI